MYPKSGRACIIIVKAVALLLAPAQLYPGSSLGVMRVYGLKNAQVHGQQSQLGFLAPHSS